ncbi:uncharacterized protein LOC124922753 [Impatiens glandulifera]|uniref:uncharacterized protein LOC124922753 n=1 Tax=Impatiens glandulifera TaxID=253017 RepID=UPI001FB0895A|nr:uncharacterized protein LOC124922753 [Impatiens glandulifera]
MFSLTTLFPLSIASLKPSLVSNLRPLHPCLAKNNRWRQPRAELSFDAPFAAAIGGCIINSFVFPIAPSQEEEEAESLIDTTDARFAVMGIISFIPYFNWMSWVFAWLDTGEARYAVYAIVYLAPYLRSNLSLSPEDSWLPIASIILCIMHIQLEVSIKNGDIQGFQMFQKAGKHLEDVDEERKKH